MAGKGKKCDCVQSYAARGHEDGIELADPNCMACDGTGWKIRELCDECDHPVSAHDPQYGCEIERGDGYVGTSDVMQALGPCGCTAASRTEAELTVDAKDIVRIEVRRTISYQGPRKWVEGCIARSIVGTVQMGPRQFVIGGAIEQTEATPDLAIEPDRSIAMHREHCAELTRRERE